MSDTPSIVFPHIMKTAGTSLIAWLQRHYDYEEILFTATTWEELMQLPRSTFAGKRFVRGHFGSGIVKLFGPEKGFVPIAVLRDPADRVISHFWHLKFSPEPHPFPFVREENFRIEDFVDHPLTRPIVSNYQTANFSSTSEYEAQPGEEPTVLPEVSPVDLRVAKEFVDSCVAVGVAEDLPGFVSTLSARLGLFPDFALPKHRSYRAAMPVAQEVLKKIRDLNVVDEELYRYVKDRSTAAGRTHSIVSVPRNPNAVDDQGLLTWAAGRAYWGRGWSDVMADERNKHIWSLAPEAQIELSVRPGESYALYFSVLRFVTPLQRDFFSVMCNGTPVELVSVFARGGDELEFYGSSLGPSDSQRLTLTFKVSRLFAFNQVSKDANTLRRGVALCTVCLLACPPRSAAQISAEQLAVVTSVKAK